MGETLRQGEVRKHRSNSCFYGAIYERRKVVCRTCYEAVCNRARRPGEPKSFEGGEGEIERWQLAGHWHRRSRYETDDMVDR